jgi:hypothetical protein
LSDEHVVYKNVLKRLPLKPLSMKFQSVSSRLSRTHHKPLFPQSQDLQRKGDGKTIVEVAGISSGRLPELLSGWGSRRPFLSKLTLSKDEKRLWFGDFKLPGTKITKYRPQYLNQ